MNHDIPSIIADALKADAFGLTTPKTLERQTEAVLQALDHHGYTITPKD